MRSPSPSSSPVPSNRDPVCRATVLIQAHWRGFRARYRCANFQLDVDPSFSSEARKRQSTARAIVTVAGDFLAQAAKVFCICVLVARIVGWISGEVFGITCPMHKNFPSWDASARNSIALHLHEAEAYLTHIYRLETDVDYLTSSALHLFRHSAASASETKHWSEVSLLEHRETEGVRAADRLADVVSALQGFGVLDRCEYYRSDKIVAEQAQENDASASRHWCAGRRHEFDCRAVGQDDSHDWVMRHAAASKPGADDDDATVCYQRAKKSLHRLRFKTSCASGWLGGIFGLKHGWCGRSLGSTGFGKVAEDLQRVLFVVEPFDCVTIDEWFRLKTLAFLAFLWNIANMLSAVITLIQQRNFKDDLEEVLPLTTNELFAGMLRVSYNLLEDKDDGRIIFAWRTLDKLTLEQFFCTKHALQALKRGCDLLKQACDQMYSHMSESSQRSDLRPHKDQHRNRLKGRYPVLHLSSTERAHMVQHIQNRISATFKNGIVARDLGVEATVAKLVFALTWEDEHTALYSGDTVRILVAKEETLRRIQKNPVGCTANLSMEKLGNRYYEERYEHLANVYALWRNPDIAPRTGLFADQYPVVGDVIVSVTK